MSERPAPPAVREFHHQPAFDGVRALAIALVMGINAFTPGLWGGFIGVSVFFVLSGFLITQLLLIEHARAGRIDLAAFYTRRARRLLPPLLCMLAAFLLLHPLLAPNGDRIAFWYDAFFALTYVSNWTYLTLHAPQWFDHTWSLAVEEQFYLLWPILIWPLLRARKPRRALVAMVVITAIALVWRHVVANGIAVAAHDSAERVYYGTDTRAFGLMLGALAAFAWNDEAIHQALTRPALRFALGWLAGLCLMILVWLGHHANGTEVHALARALLVTEVTTATLLICLIAYPRGAFASLLAIAPLRAIGRASYTLYLWHLPWFYWLQSQHRPWREVVLYGGLATLACALPAYWFIERPLLARSERRRSTAAATHEA